MRVLSLSIMLSCIALAACRSRDYHTETTEADRLPGQVRTMMISRTSSDYQYHFNFAPNRDDQLLLASNSGPVPTLSEQFTNHPEFLHWVDLGAGEARAMLELASLRRAPGKFTALAAEKPPQVPFNKPFGLVEFSYLEGYFEHQRIEGQIKDMSVDLITDYYGPVSYTRDVSRAMNLLLRKLKPGGLAFIALGRDLDEVDVGEGKRVRLYEWITNDLQGKADVWTILKRPNNTRDVEIVVVIRKNHVDAAVRNSLTLSYNPMRNPPPRVMTLATSGEPNIGKWTSFGSVAEFRELGPAGVCERRCGEMSNLLFIPQRYCQDGGINRTLFLSYPMCHQAAFSWKE